MIPHIYILDVVLASIFLLLARACIQSFQRNRKLKMPPGPAPLLVIGNLLDTPKGVEWLHWAKFKDLYGPISFINVLGQNIVILNDKKLAFDLLEKKSLIYSDRPILTFANEICGWRNTLGLARYDNRFKAMRKQLHQVIGTHIAVAKFYPTEEIGARRFLLRLLKGQDRLIQSIQFSIASVVLKLTYGYITEAEVRDPLVDMIDEAMLGFSISTQPGRWLVDVIPILQYLPDWFPGAAFKRIGKAFRKLTMDSTEVPFQFTKRQMDAGIARPSYMAALIEKGLHDEEEEETAKWSASSLFLGGSDTTVSALSSFFLAMMLYPEAQKRAQEELDAVVGKDRLPSFCDRDNLPYVNAIVKETLRWNPIAPLGIPHVTTREDVYEGYYLPKGTLVIANIWQFTHDPETYRDPLDFKPDRHLVRADGKPETDPTGVAFGFGRRICPGKELAGSMLFINIAMTLATFNIRKALDEMGREIEPICEYSSGTVSHPKEYKYSITPRSDKAAVLIRSVEEEHPIEPSDSKYLSGLL